MCGKGTGARDARFDERSWKLMSKSILARFFGVGNLPKDRRRQLEVEGLVLMDEGIRSSVTYRRYKAPWKRFWLRKNGFVGSVVLTQVRLIAFAFSKVIVNVPLEDPRFGKLRFALEADDRLCISFEASDFHTDRSGTIELRFRTPQARLFLERLSAC